MTSEETQKPTVISIISASTAAIFKNRAILVPFCWIAFFQLLCLEFIFFTSRQPLISFFGPVIRKLWGEVYLHYPANLQLIPRLFQYIQIPLFIFVSSVCVATAVGIIAKVNNDEEVNIGGCLKFALSKYVYIVVASMISFAMVLLLSEAYGMVVERALQIRSTSGKLYMLKRVVLDGAPYANLLLSVFATTLFAFLLPLIIIGKEKIIGAFANNFKLLFGSLFTVLGVVILPSLLYVPVLMLRSAFVSNTGFPEVTLILLVVSIVLIVFIDAIINTGITVLYLTKKEEL